MSFLKANKKRTRNKNYPWFIFLSCLVSYISFSVLPDQV